MKNKWSGRNALHLVISILVAVCIWIYVDETEGRKVEVTFSGIPIEFLNEDTTLADRGLMLIEEQSDTTVTLELQGKRRLISRLDPSELRIQADLGSITATGEQTINYRIIYPSNEFSNNLTVRNASSYTVRVTIGELYRKEVDVICDIEGTVPEGYIAGELQCDPATLEIRGEQSKVDQVSYAKVTLQIDELTETTTQMLDYTLYDENDEPVDMTGIHAVDDQIQVTLPINIMKELKLKVNLIESPGSSASNVSCQIEPSSITVFGDAALLKDVDSLVLGNYDLSKLTASTTLSYTIPIPDGVENSSGISRATVHISFKDLAETTVTVTDITCENIPEGKNVDVLTQELDVLLRGTSEDLEGISGDDVSLIADLENVGSASGSYTVPARVVIHLDRDIGTTHTYQVQIRITDKDDSNSEDSQSQ